MKKFNSQLNIKFKLPEFVLVILIVISGVMLAFSSGSFVVNFKSIGFTLVSTVEREVHIVTSSVKNAFLSVSELARLKKDYNELVQKLENYEQMRRTNADIRKENERLKSLLDFTTSLDEKNYPAQIIARDTDNIFSYLTIDKGSAHGIKKNMPVIAYQDGNAGVVGKITQVGRFSSIVMPLYNINCNISARIQNTRDLGIVSGTGSEDSPLSMKYIRKRMLDELHYGDIVVTSGENNNYMRDLAIGSISKITVLDYNSSLEIELTPIIDFSRLENVVVINMTEINSSKGR